MKGSVLILQILKEKNGYKWVIYSDGSGHLESPAGHNVAGFDITNKAINISGWEPFDGDFQAMQKYILKNIPSYI